MRVMMANVVLIILNMLAVIFLVSIARAHSQRFV